MTTDLKATLAFRAHAATVLSVPLEEVEGGAATEQIAATMPQTVGGAWAYTIWRRGEQGRNEVRGWATKDGTVITPDQNLGLLLAEAGVWKKKQLEQIGDRLASVLAWAYGPGHTVVTRRANGMAPPTLSLGKDGAGALVFHTTWRPAGPGGAGGGPMTRFETKIAFTPDKQATLVKAKL